MNSMPQQAVANGKGQSEFFRAQPTISSSRVTRKSAPPPAAPVAGGIGAPAELLFFAEQSHRGRILCAKGAARSPDPVRGPQPNLTV